VVYKLFFTRSTESFANDTVWAPYSHHSRRHEAQHHGFRLRRVSLLVNSAVFVMTDNDRTAELDITEEFNRNK